MEENKSQALRAIDTTRTIHLNAIGEPIEKFEDENKVNPIDFIFEKSLENLWAMDDAMAGAKKVVAPVKIEEKKESVIQKIKSKFKKKPASIEETISDLIKKEINGSTENKEN